LGLCLHWQVRGKLRGCLSISLVTKKERQLGDSCFCWWFYVAADVIDFCISSPMLEYKGPF
jgi:hypothetical protein